MKTTRLLNLMTDFYHSVFPNNCMSCSEPIKGTEVDVCVSCLSQLPERLQDHTFQEEFFKKFVSSQRIVKAICYLEYGQLSITQKLVYAVKYQERRKLGVELGLQFGKKLAKLETQRFDILIPVPLHFKRLRKRGYNQAALIAKGISLSTGLSWSDDLVRRIKETKTQTGKEKVDRWKTLENVFEVVDNQSIIGKNVAIVDDVVTTGSTTMALAECLSESGANEITVLALSGR